MIIKHSSGKIGSVYVDKKEANKDFKQEKVASDDDEATENPIEEKEEE